MLQLEDNKMEEESMTTSPTTKPYHSAMSATEPGKPDSNPDPGPEVPKPERPVPGTPSPGDPPDPPRPGDPPPPQPKPDKPGPAHPSSR
jgi:hypothetical protein